MTVNPVEPWPEVTGPQSTPYSFGLFSAAQAVEEYASGLWESGVTWKVNDRCSTGGIWPSVCTPVVPSNTKTRDTEVPDGAARAFVVFDNYACWAPTDINGAPDRARQRLAASEQASVERAVWTGVGGNIPALASDAATDLTPSTGAVTITQGIGLLEEALGCLGGVEGVLHMPRRLVPPAQALYQFWRDGSVLRTMLGNRVAAYACSPNTGPDGQPAGENEAWIYATGPVKIWRSAVSVPGTPGQWLDRSTNMYSVFAERVYLVMFDCPIVAVRVDNRAAMAMSGPSAFDSTPMPPATDPTIRFMGVDADNPRIANVVVDQIPAVPAASFVHWGDGTATPVTDATSALTHTYAQPGDYEVLVMVDGVNRAQTAVTIPAIAANWTNCSNGSFIFTVTGVTGDVLIEMSGTYTRQVAAAGGSVTITYPPDGGGAMRTARVTVAAWSTARQFSVDLSTLPIVTCSPTAPTTPAAGPISAPPGGGMDDDNAPQGS